MAERKNHVRMPLFDRLVDRDRFLRRELVQMRAIDRRSVKESVRRELEQLFNTRCPVPAHLLPLRKRTVIDYGIPDFSTFAPRNHADYARLAAILRNAIDIYEPRLANVSVEVERDRDDEFSLIGIITADLVFDGVAEPVLFTTALQMKDGSVEVQ